MINKCKRAKIGLNSLNGRCPPVKKLPRSLPAFYFLAPYCLSYFVELYYKSYLDNHKANVSMLCDTR